MNQYFDEKAEQVQPDRFKAFGIKVWSRVWQSLGINRDVELLPASRGGGIA